MLLNKLNFLFQKVNYSHEPYTYEELFLSRKNASVLNTILIFKNEPGTSQERNTTVFIQIYAHYRY